MDLQTIIDRAALNAGGELKDLARALDTGPSTIANWRNRPHSGPDPDYIPRLAELANVPWEAVQAATNAKRSRDTRKAAEWLARMEKCLATAGRNSTALGALLVAVYLTERFLVGADTGGASSAWLWLAGTVAPVAQTQYTLSHSLMLASMMVIAFSAWVAARTAARPQAVT